MKLKKFIQYNVRLIFRIVRSLLIGPIFDAAVVLVQVNRGYIFEDWVRFRKLRRNTDIAVSLKEAVMRRKTYFFHPHGIVIGTENFGKYCAFAQGVTIGYKKGFPTLGNHVTMYPNSMVLGPVSIGNNVIIGYQSVVTSNIPDGQVWAGNPAIYIRDIDPSKDLEPNKYLMIDVNGEVARVPYIVYSE
ncbi:hypothetical protein [Thalassobacter stenotrophicus]|uniref:Transferase hexapeptide (Six repeat-containing protein) n=2 Tax=Thalassobacter stenotrophicus TaxID=266809 RepID=A0ABY1I412_9RHOB|nr:hypothetical protein [Thalassobacter stenotrophicus]PVZ49358.1 hypothetical protein DD557_11765 [Thalassobacter stenotrophicus]CUH61631.1 putative lipopolysaccharide biosynthesis O-acetyl transferase WbbJ [Thalassobacter stenotrophicus]SHI45949.1 transferase hexapeptide (six repeat-containing protein) [Thalassobacter stenotrophicus DSM 16310]